jgi:hypothetical protein
MQCDYISNLDDFTLESILLLIPDTIPNIMKTSTRFKRIVEHNSILKKFGSYDGKINKILVDAVTSRDAEIIKYIDRHRSCLIWNFQYF